MRPVPLWWKWVNPVIVLPVAIGAGASVNDGAWARTRFG